MADGVGERLKTFDELAMDHMNFLTREDGEAAMRRFAFLFAHGRTGNDESIKTLVKSRSTVSGLYVQYGFTNLEADVVEEGDGSIVARVGNIVIQCSSDSDPGSHNANIDLGLWEGSDISRDLYYSCGVGDLASDACKTGDWTHVDEKNSEVGKQFGNWFAREIKERIAKGDVEDPRTARQKGNVVSSCPL